MVSHTKKIAKALHIVGLMNVQYVWDGEKVYVIEVNPRASRTVPILSKVAKVPIVKIAVAVMTGQKLADMEWGTGLYLSQNYFAVKIPVFSDAKLTDVDVAVGPEMKSTGEVLGIDKDLNVAIYKGFLGAGSEIPAEGGVFVSLKDHDKTEATATTVNRYAQLGFKLFASEGTAKFLAEQGVPSEVIAYNKVKSLIGQDIHIILNTPKAINKIGADTFPIRREAIERGLPVLTSIDTANAFATAVELKQKDTKFCLIPLNMI